MQSITDSKGNKWIVNVTVGSIRRCQALVGIDLFNLLHATPKGWDTSLYDQLATDDVLVCRVAWAVSDAHDKLSEDEFLDAIGPEQLPLVRRATLEGALDFFPLGRLIKRVLRRQQEMEMEAKKAVDKVTESQLTEAIQAVGGQ